MSELFSDSELTKSEEQRYDLRSHDVTSGLLPVLSDVRTNFDSLLGSPQITIVIDSEITA